jgi:hypothetical protein
VAHAAEIVVKEVDDSVERDDLRARVCVCAFTCLRGIIWRAGMTETASTTNHVAK